MFKTVLFPIDTSWLGSEPAAQALQLVRPHNSRLVLLSVLERECERLPIPKYARAQYARAATVVGPVVESSAGSSGILRHGFRESVRSRKLHGLF